MNDNFKNQLAAFARDIREMCRNVSSCRECKLSTSGYCAANLIGANFDPDKTIAAVEAYLNRKKPCADVVDRARDIYIYERTGEPPIRQTFCAGEHREVEE